MNLKQRPGEWRGGGGRRQGEKCPYSLIQHIPARKIKAHSTPTEDSVAWRLSWTLQDSSICAKIFTGFWWLRQKVKQEAISSPSSISRRAILEGGRPWGAIVIDLRNVKKENRRSTGSWCLIPQHCDSQDVICSMDNRHFLHRSYQRSSTTG